MLEFIRIMTAKG